jgi:hypothetical protein
MSALKANRARTRTVRDAGPAFAYETEEPSHRGAGWVLFSAMMFAVAAGLSLIWGIAAGSGSHFSVANTHYILSVLNAWGWVTIGFAAVEALAALSIWRGGSFGRWFGIIAAGVAVLVAMMSIPAYPFWSLLLVALYILVIDGLAAYGGRPELTR